MNGQQNGNKDVKLEESRIPNGEVKKNNFDFNEFIERQQWSKLKKIRADIAKYSIKKSMIRLQKQKSFQ